MGMLYPPRTRPIAIPKGEQLLLYLAATTHVVSTAIIVER
jgi:hypothetical protein